MALGRMDEVTHPYETRQKVAQAIAAAPARRGHHENIPL
jgi:acetyl-CoA/propionyl-CoA carboxylase carboxyl transferase subunit